MDLIDTQLGAYRIEGCIARGGMAEVYRAVHVDLRRPVALKVLPREMIGDAEHRARFRREMRLLTRLAHPGIVGVLDADYVEGVFFYAMPLVAHPTLEQLLDGMPEGRLDTRRALTIAASMLDTLAFVHSENVVHRDLKPSNIFIAPDDTTQISDFGVAYTPTGTVITAAGASIGTALYMSPEQVDCRPVVPASDIYAVGLVLYRMLCGSLPFSAQLAAIVKAKTVAVGLAPPHTINSAVDWRAEEIVMRACAREPGDRFPDAAAMRDAARAACEQPRSRAPHRTARVAHPPAPAGEQRAARPPSTPNAGALALALIGALAMGYLIGRRAAPRDRSSTLALVRPPPASRSAERSPSSSPSPSTMPALVGLLAGAWPGYRPTPEEIEVGQLLDGPAGPGSDRRLIELLDEVRRARPPALAVALGLPRESDVSGGPGVALFSQESRFRLVADGARCCVEMIRRLRRGQRTAPGVSTADLRRLVAYLALFHPRLVMSLSDELVPLAQARPTDPSTIVMETPAAVAEHLNRLDRALARCLRAQE